MSLIMSINCSVGAKAQVSMSVSYTAVAVHTYLVIVHGLYHHHMVATGRVLRDSDVV